MQYHQQAERNGLIIGMLADGKGYRATAKRFGLSKARIQQIWHQYKKTLEKDNRRQLLAAEERLFCILSNLRAIAYRLRVILEPSIEIDYD